MKTNRCIHCSAIYPDDMKKCPSCGCENNEQNKRDITNIGKGLPNITKPQPTSPIITCPYCQSTNTQKISGLSKAGSVALWGIFALGKTTKQWHCNNCKSDF